MSKKECKKTMFYINLHCAVCLHSVQHSAGIAQLRTLSKYYQTAGKLNNAPFAMNRLSVAIFVVFVHLALPQTTSTTTIQFTTTHAPISLTRKLKLFPLLHFNYYNADHCPWFSSISFHASICSVSVLFFASLKLKWGESDCVFTNVQKGRFSNRSTLC